MEAWICQTCGTQFTPTENPPASCPICTDERQYIGHNGQRWTTLSQLREQGHHNELQEHEPGLNGEPIMLEFEIIARGFYRPDQLHIHYDPALRMARTPELTTWIEETWQERQIQAQANGTRLFDAPLYRFISAISQPDATLYLTLGDTGYKEYVTTRIPAFAQSHPRQELGNALAVCSVVETSDGFILLDRRQGVDVYVGRYHVIGGFFERELDTTLNQPDPFAAMRREIREETGIQSADIRDQHCLAAVYDLVTPHAELCFLTRLHIPLATVLHERMPEDDEIKQLESLQVTSDSLRDFILQHHGNISATGEPNLLLYGLYAFGPAWYDPLIGILQQ